jgi:branched-chain amino acid transport system substrate-binding protein
MKLIKFATLAVAAAGIAMGSVSAAQAETLKLGIVAPLTGGGAAWGMACDVGAKILASEINAGGGLDVGGKKYQIEVISYDDQFKAADTVAAYNRLVSQDGVKFMIVSTSNGAMATKASMAGDGVIALTSGYGGKVIEPGFPNLFRFYSGPRDYVPALAKWIKENVKGNRIVMIGPNVEGGYEQSQLSSENYKKLGMDVLSSEVFEMTQKDFTPVLTKAISQKPDIIDLGGTGPATAGLMVRQARELGYKGVFVKTGGPGANEIVAAAGKEASEGMIGLLYADPSNAGYQKLAEAYKKIAGHEPNEMLLPAYDGLKALVRAIQLSGSVDDTDKVLAAMPRAFPQTSVQGDELILGGTKTYGADQQIITYNYVGVIKDGRPTALAKLR